MRGGGKENEVWGERMGCGERGWGGVGERMGWGREDGHTETN